MKNKMKKFAVTLLAAGTMMFSGALPASASYTYHSPEANGIEQKVEKEYGKAKKIKIIEVSGKDSFGIVEDSAIEVTYEDGTFVTHYSPSRKTVEKSVDGKKIIEEYDKPYRGNWRIIDRTIQYEKDDTKVEEWFTTMGGDELVLRHTKVEKPTKDGQIIEWYFGSDYHKNEEPEYIDTISEKVIYPKGTKYCDVEDEYNQKRNDGLEDKEFFEYKFCKSIERKFFEEKNKRGEVVRRWFETVLTDFSGKKEKRIEQDYEPFKRPICDGKIDFRQSIDQKRDGTYEKIDYDGDGIPDEEIHKKVVTIYLD